MNTMVLWLLCNVQNQHIVERERSTTVVVLISVAFVQGQLIYERCLHLSDTFAYRSAHNNLFLTLRVIHKVKTVLINEFISILMSTKLTLSNEQTPPPTPFQASPKNLTHLPLDEWFSCNWCVNLTIKPFAGRTLCSLLIQMQNISLWSSGIRRKLNFEIVFFSSVASGVLHYDSCKKKKCFERSFVGKIK